MITSGCTFGRVGLVDAWTCPFGANLRRKDLSKCVLNGSIMRGVHLELAKLDHTQMNNVDFTDAQLEGASMWFATMVQSVFTGANLRGIDAWLADMTGAKFHNAWLKDADLTGTQLRNAVFQDADLRDITWVQPLSLPLPIPTVMSLTHCPDGGEFLWPNDCCGHLNGYTTLYC